MGKAVAVRIFVNNINVVTIFITNIDVNTKRERGGGEVDWLELHKHAEAPVESTREDGIIVRYGTSYCYSKICYHYCYGAPLLWRFC